MVIAVLRELVSGNQPKSLNLSLERETQTYGHVSLSRTMHRQQCKGQITSYWSDAQKCNTCLVLHLEICSCYAGNGNKGLVNQMLHKTESLEAQGRHGNPFSDDSEVERYDKAPLLIASADSSYALDGR